MSHIANPRAPFKRACKVLLPLIKSNKKAKKEINPKPIEVKEPIAPVVFCCYCQKAFKGRLAYKFDGCGRLFHQKCTKFHHDGIGCNKCLIFEEPVLITLLELNESNNTKEQDKEIEYTIERITPLNNLIRCAYCGVNFVGYLVGRKTRCGHLFHSNCSNESECKICDSENTRIGTEPFKDDKCKFCVFKFSSIDGVSEPYIRRWCGCIYHTNCFRLQNKDLCNCDAEDEYCAWCKQNTKQYEFKTKLDSGDIYHDNCLKAFISYKIHRQRIEDPIKIPCRFCNKRISVMGEHICSTGGAEQNYVCNR